MSVDLIVLYRKMLDTSMERCLAQLWSSSQILIGSEGYDWMWSPIVKQLRRVWASSTLPRKRHKLAAPRFSVLTAVSINRKTGLLLKPKLSSHELCPSATSSVSMATLSTLQVQDVPVVCVVAKPLKGFFFFLFFFSSSSSEGSWISKVWSLKCGVFEDACPVRTLCVLWSV